jgi:hypothetical protein
LEDFENYLGELNYDAVRIQQNCILFQVECSRLPDRHFPRARQPSRLPEYLIDDIAPATIAKFA